MKNIVLLLCCLCVAMSATLAIASVFINEAYKDAFVFLALCMLILSNVCIFIDAYCR
jgi:hypothetical protein